MSRIQSLALSYDDVLVIPRYSEVLPSAVSLKSSLGSGLELELPCLSAAMDTVTGEAMALAMAKLGGMGVIHKNMSIEQQAKIVAVVASLGYKVAAAVGVSAQSMERVSALVDAGVTALVIDSAHGHSKGILDLVKNIRHHYADIHIIAGNIATKEAALALAEAGANTVKVGIGPGSICTTRIVAGIGVPQFTAVLEVATALQGTGVTVIADGGIKQSGDIVKALAAGAHAVMLGSMLAGTDEAPGDAITDSEGKQWKSYRGMGSIEAMTEGSADRYGQAGVKESKKLVAEGVVGTIPYKGAVEDILFQLMGGLRSGMGYCGAKNIEELWTTQFVQITASGRRESNPHSLTSFQKSPSLQ